MTQEERTKALERLESSGREFISLIRSFAQEDWKRRPSPVRWSAAETAEHVLLAEIAVNGAFQGALKAEPDPEWEETLGRLDFVSKVMGDRGRKDQAPDRLQPRREYSVDQIIERFQRIRQRTLELARTTQLPLKRHTRSHFAPEIGKLNAYQWLIYFALHNERHNLQLAQIAEELAHDGERTSNVGAQEPADPFMSEEERSELLALLDRTEHEFLVMVEGLDAEAWSRRPQTDGWCLSDVSEHLVRSEEKLFETAMKALAKPADPDWATSTAGSLKLVRSVMPDRSRKAQAGQSISPRGEWAPDELLQRFRQARGRTRRFVQQVREPLKQHTHPHAFAFFGTLNAYQWLAYIPLHNLRHNLQIEELLQSSGIRSQG